MIILRTSGRNVFIYDSSIKQLEKSNKFISSLMEKEVTKGTLKQEEVKGIKSKFNYIDNLKNLSECNFIVEAVTENFEIKQNLFKQLDSITPQTTIFASNTSSISITKLAASTQRSNKFIGMHFMNPVPVMKLVEVIRGLQTDDHTFNVTSSYMLYLIIVLLNL